MAGESSRTTVLTLHVRGILRLHGKGLSKNMVTVTSSEFEVYESGIRWGWLKEGVNHAGTKIRQYTTLATSYFERNRALSEKYLMKRPLTRRLKSTNIKLISPS